MTGKRRAVGLNIETDNVLRDCNLMVIEMEAPAGVEPAYNGFANRRLTTWLRGRKLYNVMSCRLFKKELYITCLKNVMQEHAHCRQSIHRNRLYQIKGRDVYLATFRDVKRRRQTKGRQRSWRSRVDGAVDR